MGEVLPDGSIQGYQGYCPKCKKIISTNIQGNEIGTHYCKTKKENRGGTRPGSGRKSLFKEKTKGVKFMCPISKEPDLKKYVNRKLLEWSKSGI